MVQNILDPLTCLRQWLKQKINEQWNFDNWKDFAKYDCRKWRNRHDHVLCDAVMPTSSTPTNTYMDMYKSLAIGFVSKDRYLYDPRQTTYTQEASMSNPQKNYHTYYSQPKPNKITNPQTHKSTIKTC